jgi:hypothetical protein
MYFFMFIFKEIFGDLDEKCEVFGGDAHSLSAPVIPLIREISFLFDSGSRTSRRLWNQLESKVL